MNITYFTSLFLIFLRVFAFFIALGIIFPQSFPNTGKMILSMALAFFIAPYINLSNATVLNNGLVYMWQCMCEILTGLILGFFANLIFVCARIGGQFIDFQMGFSMMSAYDPTTQTNASIMERLFNLFAVVLFFTIDGHIMLIKELVNSFAAVKLGTFVINDQSVMVAFNVFTQFFIIGIRIALPIILVLLMADLILGIVSRTVPQLNVMVLGVPIKILLGLACIIMILPIIIKLMISSFSALPDIYKGFYKLIPAALIFADGDKTESATPRKLNKAKKEGQVPRSREVTLATTLITITAVLSIFGNSIFQNLRNMFAVFFQSYLTTNLTEEKLSNIFKFAIVNGGKNILIFIVPIMIAGIAGNLLQTGFMFITEGLKPNFGKLNPVQGIKRMFSITTFVGVLKDILVVIVVGFVGYQFFMNNYSDIVNMNNLIINYIPSNYLSYITDVFKKISMIMIVIAAGDFAFQKYKFNKDMKMTKQEVKDEFKQDEGDPEIKGKRKQKMREIISRTMLTKVPDATVVITNPTHLAVALKYERGIDSAPTVVAKGADRTALKIKEIAKENDVPIIENKPMARLLFSKVEVDQEIPMDMYQTVAEILAVVYKLKNKR
ncbi:fused FliR family export protein/FlhB family type III secretion system protein [Clostridium hydrogenum]|uniref:fused FliR family export protein/FlhB family type III secretion system protein n=1 Tax=Clostridium hydrogenum TaxID=2855764 RepID=UPI002E316714|nr:fused FliR family export protein/FlhB family type III secretion system protein [Clostridium hydrogenum]